jgi:hypothetical protein
VGAFFSINVGEHIPAEERLLCFYREPTHPVLVSDDVTQLWERKLASEFAEARKTDAYVRSRKKRRK